MLSQPYTLAKYFDEAMLPVKPEWADSVTLPNPPYRHQIGDLNHFARHTRCGLYSDPGVGKTRSMQAYGLWLCSQGNKVVYVMPPVLIEQFLASFAKTYNNYQDYVCHQSFNQSVKKRNSLMKEWETNTPDMLSMSYNIFVKHGEWLKDNGFTCVIVDEATAVKSPSSQIHKAVKSFVGKYDETSNGLILVTGTPIETNVTDAYGLIALVNPKRYGSRRAFDRIHVEYAPAGVANYPIIVGYKELEYLHIGLMSEGRRVKKKDVLDLPPRIFKEITFDLSRNHKALYDDLVEKQIAELEDAKIIDLTQKTALYQAVQRTLVCPESYTSEAITNNLLEQVDVQMQQLQGRKVVMYCWYQASVEKLKEIYKHLNPACLYGKTPSNQRDAQRLKFIKDESCQLIICNPRSGGVGVDGLQEVSSHVLFVEVCPFPGVFQQSVDRLHRSGQTNTVNIYMFVPKNTVAVKLRNDLLLKDSLQQEVIQDKRKLLSELSGENGLEGDLDSMFED